MVNEMERESSKIILGQSIISFEEPDVSTVYEEKSLLRLWS